MNHIFLLHSHITYFSAKGVIKKESIDSHKIYFICTRNYNPLNEHFPIIRLDKEHDVLNKINSYNGLQYWNQIKIIDDKCKNIFKEDFTFYAPHINHSIFQIIGSHKNCKAINIIEEGINCRSENLYKPTGNHLKNVIKSIIYYPLNYLGIWGKKRYFRTWYHTDFKWFPKKQKAKFYGFSEKSFEFVPGVNELISFIPETNYSYSIENESTIIVLEGAVEQNNLEYSTLERSLNKILSAIDDSTVYIKFHPAQSDHNISRLTKSVSFLKTVEVIPQQISLEQVFADGQNYNVHGFTSSLLYYAKILGHNVTSHEKLLIEDPKFINFRKLNDFNLSSILKGA